MASKGQIEKALEVKVVATGQPLEYNPYQRINRSGAELFRRSAPRIRIQAKVAEPHGRYSYRSSGVEAAEMELYNIDGEIMLKHIYGSMMFFGRHEPTEESNRYGSSSLGRNDKNGILHDKAEKTAKELQKILDDAGYGEAPDKNAVTLREIREEGSDLSRLQGSLRSALGIINGREWRHFYMRGIDSLLKDANNVVNQHRASGDETAATLVEKLGGEG